LKKLFPLLTILAFVASCRHDKDSSQKKQFTLLPSTETGIDFINKLEESENFDVFRYRNYYNGAGVSIGDINNDGLSDIYLTSNLDKNKLYLNQGNFHFKDITESAGVGGTRAWSTGVSMVDINADGLLDIYVCNSGDIEGDDKENELFVNNGNLTFTERAKEYGLADEGFSTHAVFFDYDKDGDLDCYLLNNSFRSASKLGYRNIRNERDKLGGHKLLRNDNGYYNDVSDHAGIYGSLIGFGLGVTVGDVNNDNWPDIYVSNDFFERDYLYINNRNGTFSEKLEDEIGHTSMFSMGADLADLNNDGYLDIFSTDMLPNDDYRLKTVASFESYDIYKLKVKNGYYHQYMRNMLQLNNQDGTFSEVGQFANVWATDWSWGALMADFNNDGDKEIFVANGILRDVTDQDFLDYMANEENIRAVLEGRKINYQKVIKDMPSHKLSNFMFIKDGELHYKNVSEEWGLSEPSFSNGSAYGDLDNDGDLDLVVNNVNQQLFVYRNENQQQNKSNNYLRLQFKGKEKNSFGLGAKVEVFTDSGIITQENMPIRGYQSSMDYKMIVGLGSIKRIDSMRVIWPDETSQLLTKVEVNKSLVLKQDDAVRYTIKEKYKQPLLQEIKGGVNFVHHENNFNQFNAEKSIYQMMSTEGPALAIGDLNNDKLDDFFVGGAHGQPGTIFIQGKEGSFTRLSTKIFDQDSVSEATDAIFFDADNDNDLDLYVVTGGSQPDLKSDNLADILYLNMGAVKGTPVFQKSADLLPLIKQNGSCVKVADYDKDGDEDLFVGTRSLPGKYGLLCDQSILQNDGHGKFTDVSSNSPDLKSLGMITDAQWFDYDKDGLSDLIVVGDWMPVTILMNGNGIFKKLDVPSLKDLSGWWNTIEKSDIDGDGDVDFVLGNLGLNTKFKASKQQPVSLYVNDFDHNNALQQIYTYRKNDIDFPFATKQELSRQINSLNKKFVYHKDYASKSINEIFSSSQLEGVSVLQVNESRSGLLINEAESHTFSFNPLPANIQFSPVFDFQIADLNGDKNDDLICGGNLFSVRTEVGRYDASYGNVLLGNGKGEFKLLSSKDSGIKLRGEVRAIAALKGIKTQFLFGLNNDTLRLYKLSVPR